MTSRSAFYVGHVAHQRVTPKRHALRNRVYWLLVDLEELAAGEFASNCRLCSHNRSNLISFHNRDHGDGGDRPLLEQALAHLVAAGVDATGMRVELLCMPRVAGYDFNPISVYFCRQEDGELTAVIYEVNNTFGGRHSYVIPVYEQSGEAVQPVHQTCEKQLYVSPFMDLDMTYRFQTSAPGDNVNLIVQARQADQTVIHTSLKGTKRPLSDRNILALSVTHPVLPMKVTGAIHWHALKMWLRGFKVNPTKPSRTKTVSIVPPPQ